MCGVTLWASLRCKKAYVGVDGLASLAEDRKNLFPDQVAQLLELRGNNYLLSVGR